MEQHNMGAIAISEVLESRKRRIEAESLADSRLPPFPSHLEQFWIDITLPDGYESRTLVMRARPKSPLIDFLDSPRITSLRKSPKRPLLIYFFGGGFYSGSPLSLTLPARLFAEHLNATVLVPTYRLAPEHPWPAPFRDAMSIVQTVARDPTYHYGADLEQGFMIGGVSAGGSLAAVVAGLTTADHEQYPLYYPLTGVFISQALLLTESIVPHDFKQNWTSREDNHGPIAEDSQYSAEDVLAILKCFDYTSPLFSPINNPASTRHRHPSICLHACQNSPLRDDTIVYEKFLAAAGVNTRINIFPDETDNALTTIGVLRATDSKDSTIEAITLEDMKWLAAQLPP